MTSYKTFFPSTYLQQEDLKGREHTVAISEVTSAKVGDEQKMIVYFQNHQKGMVCNRVNGDTLSELYGEDVEEWIGREIVLYVDPTVMYAGKRVGGIRMKAPQVRSNTKAQHVIKDRGTHKISTLQPPPADDPMDEPIPF